jgi:hypothetical protein
MSIKSIGNTDFIAVWKFYFKKLLKWRGNKVLTVPVKKGEVPFFDWPKRRQAQNAEDYAGAHPSWLA